jgi:hypothetical protein
MSDYGNREADVERTRERMEEEVVEEKTTLMGGS